MNKNYFLGAVSFLMIAGFVSFINVNTVTAESGPISNFESAATSTSVNGQEGWSITGTYDQEVVELATTSPLYSGSNTKAFRISNGIASGSFGDQTFAAPLVDGVGETSSTAGTFATGTLQNHFEMEMDFATATTSEQTGLNVTVSPDRGDGSRMSYLKFEDTAGGINVVFFDAQGTSSVSFVSKTVATGLSREAAHKVKMTIDIVEGPSNDIVKVYVDNTLVHVGTSWENYFRYSAEASAEQSPRIIKTIGFFVRGSSVPSNLGGGFLFDNVTLSSSNVTLPAAYVVTDPTLAFATPVTANSSTYYAGLNTYTSVQSAVDAAATSSTVYITAGTYTEQVLIEKDLTVIGTDKATTIIKAPTTLTAATHGKKSIVEVRNGATVTASGLTITGNGGSVCANIDYGFFALGASTVNLSNMNVTDIRSNPIDGCQFGRAIFIGSSALAQTATATINNVSITSYQKSGIYADGAGTTATVTNNTITGVGATAAIAQNGITFATGATGSIKGNTITGNIYSGTGTNSAGVLLFNQGAGVEVSGNTITGNQLGVAFSGTIAALVKNNNLSNNSVRGLSNGGAMVASPNFWGSAANPTTTNMLATSTLVTYSPWYTDSSMTTLASDVVTTASTTSATFTNESVTTLTSTIGSIEVNVPANVTISGPATWDGVFTLPTVTSTSTLPYEKDGLWLTGVVAIEFGAGNTPLTFSDAVKIVFPGQAGKQAGWTQNSVFQKITTTCDSATSPTISAGGDCKIDVGADLVVWTKHATTFIAYSEVAIPYGGGGSTVSSGGSSGSTGQVLGASTSTVNVGTTPGIIVTVSTSTVPGQVLGATAFAFARNLGFGARGDDVTELQKVLIAHGYLKIDAPTKYFGPLTRVALAKWQAKSGVPATGYFGVLSRAAIAK